MNSVLFQKVNRVSLHPMVPPKKQRFFLIVYQELHVFFNAEKALPACVFICCLVFF
jgi:hypothetical protein